MAAHLITPGARVPLDPIEAPYLLRLTQFRPSDDADQDGSGEAFWRELPRLQLTEYAAERGFGYLIERNAWMLGF